jgi:Leucine-rich repeat (LRR) protein
VAGSTSDAWLGHLKGLTNLSSLDLSNTQVTDAGIAHLKGLRELSIISLDGTQVTDAGIEELNQALPSLKICLSTSGSSANSSRDRQISLYDSPVAEPEIECSPEANHKNL